MFKVQRKCQPFKSVSLFFFLKCYAHVISFSLLLCVSVMLTKILIINLLKCYIDSMYVAVLCKSFFTLAMLYNLFNKLCFTFFLQIVLQIPNLNYNDLQELHKLLCFRLCRSTCVVHDVLQKLQPQINVQYLWHNKIVENSFLHRKL